MGSITFQVVGDVTVGTKNKTYTVSDADINRLVAAYQKGDGTVTVTTALLSWAADILTFSKQRVRDWESQQAFKNIVDIASS